VEENLIAPCGMNCGLCVNYLAGKHKLNKQGFHKKYCPGCIARGENCLFMKDQCDLVGNGLVRFCFECADFPCKRLKTLDKRYLTKYHMSMIDNLVSIKKDGMENFLENQTEKWRCPECGGTICCHNGLCLHCSVDKLRENKKYRWEGE